MASKKQPRFGRNRIAFVKRYVSDHPRLNRNAAITRANRLWFEHKEELAAKRAYPRFTATLENEGLSRKEALKYSRQFYKLNQEYYKARDHPPMQEDIMGGFSPKSQEQIRDEWLMDFEDLWTEALGDTFNLRSEIYTQEN